MLGHSEIEKLETLAPELQVPQGGFAVWNLPVGLQVLGIRDWGLEMKIRWIIELASNLLILISNSFGLNFIKDD